MNTYPLKTGNNTELILNSPAELRYYSRILRGCTNNKVGKNRTLQAVKDIQTYKDNVG